MARKISDINKNLIEKNIKGRRIFFEIRDGLIYDSSQKEPYEYLTSSNIPVIQMIISNAIKKTENVIEYPEYISAMDREYIEANFEEYMGEIEKERKRIIRNNPREVERKYFVEEDMFDTRLDMQRILQVLD